jgi:hypothetical protein
LTGEKNSMLKKRISEKNMPRIYHAKYDCTTLGKMPKVSAVNAPELEAIDLEWI